MDNDRRGRWANIVMDNGDPCWIGIAQTGVLVRKSRVGLFGAKLYEEKNVYKAAKTAQALDALYPSKLTPSSMSNPVLAAFVNSVLHCRDLAETTRILNEAIGIEESLAETARVLSQVVTADDLKPRGEAFLPVDPSRPFDVALAELDRHLLGELGLPPSSSITDAAATVLTHITSFALTENGRFPFPSSLSIDAACSGAAFMSACLTPVSVRAKEAGAVIESKEALSTAGHGVFHAYPLADRVEIIVEGTKLYKWIVSEAFSRPNVKEWLDSVYTLVQFYVQTGERKWAVVVGQAIRVDRSRSRLKPTCSQRTRLLGIRSGRSLRSLGSPLNARPLGGHDESMRRVRKA